MAGEGRDGDDVERERDEEEDDAGHDAECLEVQTLGVAAGLLTTPEGVLVEPEGYWCNSVWVHDLPPRG